MRWKSVGVVAGEMVIDILKWFMRQSGYVKRGNCSIEEDMRSERVDRVVKGELCDKALALYLVEACWESAPSEVVEAQRNRRTVCEGGLAV